MLRAAGTLAGAFLILLLPLARGHSDFMRLTSGLCVRWRVNGQLISLRASGGHGSPASSPGHRTDLIRLRVPPMTAWGTHSEILEDCPSLHPAALPLLTAWAPCVLPRGQVTWPGQRGKQRQALTLEGKASSPRKHWDTVTWKQLHRDPETPGVRGSGERS